jgi:hypothetical protein
MLMRLPPCRLPQAIGFHCVIPKELCLLGENLAEGRNRGTVGNMM